MTNYLVKTPFFTAELHVSNFEVLLTSPELHWMMGKQFEDMRDYCQQHGWTVVPILDAEYPEWLEYKGDVYQFSWDENVLQRITRHPKDSDAFDIRYDDLPECLKELL